MANFCHGQTALSARDAVAYALAHRPDLNAAGSRTEASEQSRRQAGLRPNPRLFLQSEDLRPASPFVFGQDAESYAYLTQDIEVAGKRKRRVDVATQQMELTRTAGDNLRRQIAKSVLDAYWQAVAAQRTRDLYRESAQYFEEILAYNQARFKEGKLAEVDLMRVRLEGERVRAAAAEAELESDRAMLILSREMAAPPGEAYSLSETFDEMVTLKDVPADADVTTLRPEGKAAVQSISEAKANLALQRASGKPDLNALMGYKRNGSLDTAIVGLQLDLPLFNRNQGNVGAAEANLRAAEQNLSSVRNQLNYELALAKREYEMRLNQYQQVFKPLLDEAVQISDVSRAAYKEGGLDLVRMLDAERLRIDAQLSWVNALTAYHQSVVALQYAEGVEP